MAYFKYFNKISYDVRGSQDRLEIDTVTNILQRVRLRLDGIKYRSFFAQHIIHDGETPEYLAHQFYGDSELHWIVLFANGNKIQYPWYDWPITQYDLTKFVTKKYGSANINGTHHYEDTDGYQVDSTAPTATIVTNFKYEEVVNDAKRTIRIMQPQYVGLVVDEFKRLMAQH